MNGTTWRSSIRIAIIELNAMFYSPVAWLIIVVFAFQAGWTYSDLLNELIHQQALGGDLSALTGKLFGEESFSGIMSENNFFSQIANYLYLYMPLMTMGLLSKEYSSGSIRLLFSSPVSNVSIVLGKYMAIMTFSVILLFVVMGYVVYSGIVVEQFDWGHVWAGMIGLLLLIATYAAIGLFMSSLTAYPVVAAIGTLALLAVLNYIGGVGQDIGFVRDITYWLALSGKTRDFILGMIPSESVVYFLSLITFFLYITWLRLGDLRIPRTKWWKLLRYAGASCMLLVLAWSSSRPSCKFYADWTYVKNNTLSQESQEVLANVDGPLHITTYVNMLDNYVWQEVLPSKVKDDMKRFERYVRFKPEIEMDYVYYWDEAGNDNLKETYPTLSNRERAELICRTNGVDFNHVLSPEEIKQQINLKPFGNKVVRRFECANGKHDYLPIYHGHDMHAQEPEISAVFKHLNGEHVKVAFVEKHNVQRSILNPEAGGYWWQTFNFFNRSSLLAMGFDVEPLDLNKEQIPENVDILVVPPLEIPLSKEEQDKIRHYIRKGGNLFLMSDNGVQHRADSLLSDVGVRFTEELAVCSSMNPTVVMAEISEQAFAHVEGLERITNQLTRVVQKDVNAIDYSQVTDFSVTPIIQSPPEGVWLEKETLTIGEDSLTMNVKADEKEGRYPFLVAMERSLQNKTQRILIGSDPRWFNTEYTRWAAGPNIVNYKLKPLLMRWLSHGKLPVLAERPLPVDNHLILKSAARKYNTLVMVCIVPGLLLLLGLVLVGRRTRV